MTTDRFSEMESTSLYAGMVKFLETCKMIFSKAESLSTTL